MRVLLINSNRFKQPWPVIPFGVCCVAAAAEAAGHEVRVLDLCFSATPGSDVQRVVREYEPQVVGVGIRNIDNCSGFNTQFLLDDIRREVIEHLKAVCQVPIVIGGAAVGISGEEILEYLDLEYAIRGDGEAAFVEFIRQIEQDERAGGLGGLIVRRGGRIVENNEPWRSDDLDGLPRSQAHRYVDLSDYRRYDSPIQIQTKRGCALHCAYCTYNRIEGHRWRLRDPEAIADEIEGMVRATGINHFEFTDSTFNLPLDHAKAVLRAIIARGLDLRLRTMGINPGAVDEELADLLVAAQFHDVDLGVESGCDRVLKGLGKSFVKADVLRAGKLLESRGISVMWCLLAGGEGETEESLKETFETIDAAASPWSLVDIGIGLRVYKGSAMAKRMTADCPERATENYLHPVTYQPAGLTLERLKVLTKWHAMKRANYFMYDENQTTPALLLRVGACLMRWFAPQQPVWKLFILLRRLETFTGFSALKRLHFSRVNRAVLFPSV